MKGDLLFSKKVKKLQFLFWKASVQSQATNHILKNPCVIVLISILVLVTMSEIEDNKLKEIYQKSEIRLDVPYWIGEIFILVSNLKKCLLLTSGSVFVSILRFSFSVSLSDSITKNWLKKRIFSWIGSSNFVNGGIHRDLHWFWEDLEQLWLHQSLWTNHWTKNHHHHFHRQHHHFQRHYHHSSRLKSGKTWFSEKGPTPVFTDTQVFSQ